MHVNRLKRAHGQDKESRPTITKEQRSHRLSDSFTTETEVDLNMPSRTHLREEESFNSDETEGEVEGTDRSLDDNSDESDWTPGSLYFQRKLRDAPKNCQ